METLERRIVVLESALKMAGIIGKCVLTFGEAVTYSGLSPSYLYKLTSSNQIPYYKPKGKILFFDRKELESWLLQNRITPQSEIEAKAQDYCSTGKLKGKAV